MQIDHSFIQFHASRSSSNELHIIFRGATREEYVYKNLRPVTFATYFLRSTQWTLCNHKGIKYWQGSCGVEFLTALCSVNLKCNTRITWLFKITLTRNSYWVISNLSQIFTFGQITNFQAILFSRMKRWLFFNLIIQSYFG